MKNLLIRNELLKERIEIEKQIEEAKRDLDAINRLLDRFEEMSSVGLSAKNPASPLIVEAAPPFDSTSPILDYDRNLKWEDKVLVALKELDSGFVVDVAAKLREFEPELQEEKAFKIATLYLSRLNRDGKIGYEKHGRKYKYYIKSPDDSGVGT